MTQLILASASPRRKELLAQIGVPFRVFVAEIDETPSLDELPLAYVERMAETKANEAWKKFKSASQDIERIIILASDTSVVVDQCILGKPENKTEFVEMMWQLSARQHEVITSVCALELVSSVIKSHRIFSVTTKVNFKDLTIKEIEAYWLTGEPKDKAGGYGIQGKGAVFIESIEGSYSSVVGLPLKETAEMLTQYGINIWSS